MDILHQLIKDFWLILAIIAVLLQIYFIHSARFIVVAFAAGLVHILLVIGDLKHADYLLQIGIFLAVALPGYMFVVPTLRRHLARKDIIDHNPIGDFARVYGADLRKDNLGKIMWHGQARKAYIDNREDCDFIKEDASVIITDYKHAVFYVKPDDMTQKILANNKSGSANENM